MINSKVFLINHDIKNNPIDFMNTESILKTIFGSKKNVTILRDKFKTQPVVLRGGNNDDRVSILKELLFDLDVKTMIDNSASENGTHVWLKQYNEVNTTTEVSLESIIVSDVMQAIKLYQAGHSLYCRAPVQLESAVIPRILSELGIGIAGSDNDRFRRGEIETFYSKKGHLTDFHTDFQENITIQLSGKKKWSFSSSSAVAPLRACTPHFNNQSQDCKTTSLKQDRDLAEQQLKVLRLEPGDVLYHPAGIWHKVECIEDSIAINISLIGASYAEVFCSGLQQLLMQNPNWRQSVNGGCFDKDIKTKSLKVMTSIIDELPNVIQGLKGDDFLPYSCFDKMEVKNNNNEIENSNDSDNESNEDEDEDDNIEITIDAAEIDIDPIFLSNNTKLRLNPLAKILNSKDLSLLGWKYPLDIKTDDDKREIYIVHCSFGNETFESLTRKILLVPLSMKKYLKVFNNLKIEEHFSINSFIDHSKKRKHEEIINIPEQEKILIQQLLTSFYHANAITIL